MERSANFEDLCVGIRSEGMAGFRCEAFIVPRPDATAYYNICSHISRRSGSSYDAARSTLLMYFPLLGSQPALTMTAFERKAAVEHDGISRRMMS